MVRMEAFSQPHFDSTEWINTALSEKEDEGLEAYLAALNLKIHITTQEYTEQLELQMQDIATSAPRMLIEVKRIEDLLKNIEEEKNGLSSQLLSFDTKNASGIEDLCHLDILKTNLEKCKDILEQHHKWNILLQEAKLFIQGSGKLSESADRLELMYKSLEVLNKMPGHEERQSTCTNLRENLLSSFLLKIRKDLLAIDLSPVHEYVYVYTKIGKLAEFEIEYINCRSTLITQEWELLYTQNKLKSIPEILEGFYISTLKILQDESMKANELFGTSSVGSILCRIVTESFQTISLPCIELLKNISSPIILLQAYSTTESFIDEFTLYFSNIMGDKTSISTMISPAIASILKIYESIIDQYILLEERYTQAQITNILNHVVFSYSSELRDRNDSSESLYEVYNQYGETLVSSSDYVFQVVNESIKRGNVFLCGICSKFLMHSLTTLVNSYVKNISLRLTDLRVALGLGSHTSNHFQSPNKKTSEIGIDGTENLGNSKIADILARKLRHQEHHVIDERMLVPCALRGLQFVGRFTASLIKLNTDTDKLLDALFHTLFGGKSRGSDTSTILLNCLFILERSDKQADLRNYLSKHSKTLISTSTTTTATTGGSGTVNSFAIVPSTYKKLRTVAGNLIIDLSTSVSLKLLQYLHEELIWNKEIDPILLQDSMLPQPIITQIGEHILSLVQEIETFCTSTAQSDMVAALGDASLFATAGWQQLRTLLDIKEEESLTGLCMHSSCHAVVVAAEISMFGNPLSSSYEGEEIFYDIAQGSEEEAIHRFVNEWMGAILDTTFGLVFCQLVQIKKFTTAGKMQLEADLGYLRNVVSALGAIPHPLLIHLSLLIYKEPVLLNEAVKVMLIQSPISALLYKIDSTIARALLAGYNVSDSAVLSADQSAFSS